MPHATGRNLILLLLIIPSYT